jgi:hypothetical protein
VKWAEVRSLRLWLINPPTNALRLAVRQPLFDVGRAPGQCRFSRVSTSNYNNPPPAQSLLTRANSTRRNYAAGYFIIIIFELQYDPITKNTAPDICRTVCVVHPIGVGRKARNFQPTRETIKPL